MDSNKVLIILDPGHGGKDPGAIFDGAIEADRVAFCNKHRNSEINDVFFISIHCNAALSDIARGMEVYVSQMTRRSQLSDRMASSISSFLKRAGWRVRSRLNTDYKQANFYVLNHTFCPAVLVENLFITNGEDRKLLKEKWPELARLEAIGIAKFIKCL